MKRSIVSDPKRALVAIIAAGLVWSSMALGQARAEPAMVGPDKCQKCHRDEHAVWKGTAHFKSFRKVHKSKTAKKIVKAVGQKRMKRAEVCATCHYTVAAKKAGGKARPVAGPSCESCHGRASEWINVHNDFGGAGVKRDQETAAHKDARIRNSVAAGMIRPSSPFDVARNCISCHFLANAALPAGTRQKMLDNGHPLSAGFELVSYSQGSVRHRFYPPDVTNNKPMTPAELARLYVVGQGAALVTANQAVSGAKHAGYREAQEKRIATAKAVLQSIAASLPEARALLDTPTAANGRALAKAVADKDLTQLVGANVPKGTK